MFAASDATSFNFQLAFVEPQAPVHNVVDDEASAGKPCGLGPCRKQAPTFCCRACEA